MLAVDTQSLFSAPQETASIGNKGAGKSQVLLTSDKAIVTFVGVRWDGDKVRGIRMELSDGSFEQAGGYDDANIRLPDIVSSQAKRSSARASETPHTGTGACVRSSSRRR
jgi:hypothetical protein